MRRSQRGYFIIDTGKYGLVAAVAVGLSEIGSLVILVFEPGKYVAGGIKVRLGNQIGIFDTDGE